ncbi:Hypothetical protein D9617_6g093050 [Elsinoe fawcettii]|nr:Hypothetical protein D9617_6g093050 [Elsinoe fawcettii]
MMFLIDASSPSALQIKQSLETKSTRFTDKIVDEESTHSDDDLVVYGMGEEANSDEDDDADVGLDGSLRASDKEDISPPVDDHHAITKTNSKSKIMKMSGESISTDADLVNTGEITPDTNAPKSRKRCADIPDKHEKETHMVDRRVRDEGTDGLRRWKRRRANPKKPEGYVGWTDVALD